MTVSGRMTFLPWVTIPKPALVGGFRFVPLTVNDTASVFGPDIGDVAAKAMRTHVNQSGEPIESCTVMLRPRAAVKWDISEKHWDAAETAASLLALCCLSEQRFLEGHFQPHMNAAMFRAVSMRVMEGSEEMGLRYRRRGGDLHVGGRKFAGTVFQQPPQIEGTSCGEINLRLGQALWAARRAGHPIWDRLESSLELFLLANSEAPDLGWDSCVMLSAIAFEHLIQPKESKANLLAEAFAALWVRFPSISVANAKRVKPDRSKHGPDQMLWAIHRKWMKELYEAGSARAHRGTRPDLSSNWDLIQHIVIAAYVFPLVLKVMLADAGLYVLDDDETVACEVLDELLDSDWGNGWMKPPEWPTILGEARGRRSIRRSIERAMAAP